MLRVVVPLSSNRSSPASWARSLVQTRWRVCISKRSKRVWPPNASPKRSPRRASQQSSPKPLLPPPSRSSSKSSSKSANGACNGGVSSKWCLCRYKVSSTHTTLCVSTSCRSVCVSHRGPRVSKKPISLAPQTITTTRTICVAPGARMCPSCLCVSVCACGDILPLLASLRARATVHLRIQP